MFIVATEWKPANRRVNSQGMENKAYIEKEGRLLWEGL